ncbi:ABC transporter substrate-binding protein [Actinokineospora spheciospongiae]|uniref:ABC transporter substrate-binding protein n=1 Tax=Actinokineospora spheciospongiae TaxID=909613 RepID=UPI000D71249D|nr:ABC transporter substrate-binding protein [Actinokineospora spheciospongiae]PWW66557.1 amino acid/amide ABC transporter substrate-binding protein (HAAT family) [Actinokineospora spheciospongiae]
MLKARIIGLSALLLLSACGGAGETDPGGGGAASGVKNETAGITDTSIVIGTHQPLTGPAASGYASISAGSRAVYSYVNDAGGINGRKIDYRVEDDGYNPTKTVEVVKKLVLQDQVFAVVGGLGTPTHSKVLDFLTTEGVPDVLVSSGALAWDDPAARPMTYGFQVDYTRESKILGKYVKENLAGKKVGVLYQNDDVGRDAQAGLDQFVKDAVVSRQPYDSANTDVLPQLTALKGAGAEVVVCECVPAFTALAVLTSARLGYKPQFVVNSIGADTRTLSGLLSAFSKQAGAEVSPSALLTGMIGAGYLPGVDTDDPWITLFKEIHQRYIPDVPLTNTLVSGMAQAYTFAQAVKLAGRDLTRSKLLEAMSSGSLSGPGMTPFAFSKDSHAGYTGAFVFTVSPDLTPKVVQEPMVTDRGTGPITAAPTARRTPAEVALVG